MTPPAFDALMNSTSAALLAAGYAMIRRGRIRSHRACMGGAFAASAVFLVSYVLYHAHAGHIRYAGLGWRRSLYLCLLASHTLLAMLIVPLALRTFYLAWRGRWGLHRRWAQWTLPLWFYVSVTGVVIYEMLY